MIAAASISGALTSELNGRNFRISGCEARIDVTRVEVFPDESILIRVEYTCANRTSRFEYLFDEIPPYQDQRPVAVASGIAALFMSDLVESEEAIDG
jgi:hypothetical protein